MSARETLKKIAEDRRLFHLHPQDQDAIRTVLSELEQAERERDHLSIQIVRLAQFFLSTHPDWIGEGGAVDNAIFRIETLLRERDEARECSTLMERERDAARGRAADAEARIAALIEALEEVRATTDGVPDQSCEIAHEIAVVALVEAKGGAK